MKTLRNLLFSSAIFLFTSTIQGQKIFDLMDMDGVNLKEVQDEAATYFATVGTGKGTGYKFFKRWEYHALLNLQEDGTVISREMHSAAIRSSKKAATHGAKTISPSNWTELGPLVMTSGAGGISPGLGRVTAIYVEPKNQKLIYVGCPGGGLWKSTNSGNSWSPLGDNFDNMHIWSIEADPNNNNLVYVGNSAGQLHKSTDGGLSFTTTPLLDAKGKLRDLLINPNNTKEIYAAAINDGLYHTTDRGSSWTKVIDADIEDVRFKPGSTTTVYACGDDFYRSTDSGTSFSKITNGIETSYRMKLAVSPADPNYVYIVQRGDSGFGYLYRSTDSGNKFTVQSDETSGDFIGENEYRDMAIAVSDTNINEVHIGGYNIFKSNDGGVTFEQETSNATTLAIKLGIEYIHADIEVLEYINGNLYVGSDGGISRGTDAGATFTDLSTGLGIQQFYRIANSAINKNIVVGGTQDNGCTIKSDASKQWMQFFGSDGMDSMIDFNNEDVIFTCNQFGRFLKTIDGGLTFLRFGTFVKPPENGEGNWITPIAMDSNNSKRIYAGYADLYRHDNAAELGSEWVNTSLSIDFGAKLSHVELCPSNSDVIYVSTPFGLYKSTSITSASPTWTTLLPPMASASYITEIAVDPYDENKVALGTSAGHVLLSADGGASWTRIDDGLPTTSIKSIVFDRSPDNGIYVAINGVVFYKSNRVTDWTVFSDNLPNVEIRELELYYDKEAQEESRIRVATFGRGLWESPLYDDRKTPGNSCIDGFSNPYTTIEAEDLCLQLGVEIEADGQSIGYIQNEDYIKINAVNFGAIGAESFSASVGSATSGGLIEIHLDNPTGTLVGSCNVGFTGGWKEWTDVSDVVTNATGIHDVYLVFKGHSEFLYNINSFSFKEIDRCEQPIDAYTVIEAEAFCEQSGVEIEPDGQSVGYIENGDYIKFNSVVFGNSQTIAIEANVASATSGGTIEIRLDDPAGTIVGTCHVKHTGGWKEWAITSDVVSNATGTHDVYAVFKGGSGYLFNIDWFRFSIPLTLNKERTVELESESNAILLFPNPVSTTMHLQLRTAGEATMVSITNVLGQVVTTTTFDTHQGLNLLKMNIKGLPSGLYNVIILKGETKLIKTMVIEK